MLKIIRLAGLNAVSIQQDEDTRHFISSHNSFVISIPTLAYIILSMLKSGFMDEEVLLGILEEYHTGKVGFENDRE